MTDPLLAVRDLEKHFPVRSGVLGRQVGTVRAVDGVSLDVYPGETLAVVGESGCGKTTMARAALRLADPTGGEVRFRGDPLADRSRAEMRAFRRETGFVFQDPRSSLNERMTVGRIVREPLDVHGEREGERDAHVDRLLDTVGLSPDRHRGRYPHELSGGQQQRVAVARALALEPALVVADEPTSALDVSIKARILELLEDLQAEFGLTYLLITHDMSVVRHVADRVAVMYLGRVVETGAVDRVFADPQHPYTEALLSNVPRVSPSPDRGDRIRLEGDVPDPADPPSGCHFHPRCHLRAELDDADAARCEQEDPAPRGDRGVRCHFRPREE